MMIFILSFCHHKTRNSFVLLFCVVLINSLVCIMRGVICPDLNDTSSLFEICDSPIMRKQIARFVIMTKAWFSTLCIE